MAHLKERAPLPESEEIALIEMFGAQAVYGGLVDVVRMRSLLAARNLMDTWYSRERSEDWAKWAEKNPQHNRLLTWAERVYRDGE